MHYAVLADIHSNLIAFQTVLQDIEEHGGADEIWCLGDVVGYGPQPKECIQLLRQHKHVCVAGNHDLAAIAKIDIADFNPDAAAAARWTADQLDPDSVAYLDSLPLTLERDSFTLVHGSPRHPVWEYLLSEISAQENLPYLHTRCCLIGHSHMPLCFICSTDGSCSVSELGTETRLGNKNSRLIINPGGVGQPRDGDSRASYAIYDAEAGVLRHYRVPYDIVSVQQKMAEAGLPEHLAMRLSYGW